MSAQLNHKQVTEGFWYIITTKQCSSSLTHLSEGKGVTWCRRLSSYVWWAPLTCRYMQCQQNYFIITQQYFLNTEAETKWEQNLYHHWWDIHWISFIIHYINLSNQEHIIWCSLGCTWTTIYFNTNYWLTTQEHTRNKTLQLYGK